MDYDLLAGSCTLADEADEPFGAAFSDGIAVPRQTSDRSLLQWLSGHPARQLRQSKYEPLSGTTSVLRVLSPPVA